MTNSNPNQCNICKNKIENGSSFCNNCGAQYISKPTLLFITLNKIKKFTNIIAYICIFFIFILFMKNESIAFTSYLILIFLFLIFYIPQFLIWFLPEDKKYIKIWER